MRRREFIAASGAVALTSFDVSAQPRERLRRIGLLIPAMADDPEYQSRTAVFLQALGELGWRVGRNLQIDIRWSAGDPNVLHQHATELVALNPDVLLAPGSATVGALLQVTRSLPIVFTTIPDPVAAGFIDSLARPGGNATGFIAFEYGLGAKWLELLKEISPRLKRVAVLRNPDIAAGVGQFAALQSAAPALGVELTPINFREIGNLEPGLAAFKPDAASGLIVAQSTQALVHRERIVETAARLKLPAIYSGRVWIASGGLIAYSPDRVDQFRQAAAYVDRILKGEKPADLPVQTPTRYELAINLKTAKALGLAVPASLIARADEVIE